MGIPQEVAERPEAHGAQALTLKLRWDLYVVGWLEK